MGDKVTIGDEDVLLVVDPQNDFCSQGSLPVPDGEAVMPLINRLAERFNNIVVTQDWHPAGHLSFASSHPGRHPFETVAVDYGDQVLWPDHCVQDTPGAAFHPALHLPRAQLVLRKGFHRAIDSYSAFTENDRKTSTGLAGYLRDRGIARVFVVGLAFDYCVRYSAEDAHRHGFAALPIEDACRAIDLGGGPGGSLAATRESFARLGIRGITSEALL